MLKSMHTLLFTEIDFRKKFHFNILKNRELHEKTRKEIFYLLSSFSNRNIPLIQTLLILENEFPKISELKKVKNDILQGIPLSISLKEHYVGDEFVLATLHIGEESGTIAKALENCYEYYKNKEKTKEELLKISVYPMIVLCNILLLFLFTFNTVFPSLIEVYESSNIPLPSNLKFFNSIYLFQNNHRASIWILFTWLLYGGMKFWETEKCHDYFGEMKFKIPIVSRVKKLFFKKDFLWRISCLLDSGIAIKESLQILESTEKNKYLKSIYSQMIFSIQQGKSLSDVMENYSQVFHFNDISYIRQGEESGGVQANIQALCFLYKRDAENLISKISNYGQPIMILFLGLLVGMVAFSMIPFLNMTEMYMQ